MGCFNLKKKSKFQEHWNLDFLYQNFEFYFLPLDITQSKSV